MLAVMIQLMHLLYNILCIKLYQVLTDLNNNIMHILLLTKKNSGYNIIIPNPRRNHAPGACLVHTPATIKIYLLTQ